MARTSPRSVAAWRPRCASSCCGPTGRRSRPGWTGGCSRPRASPGEPSLAEPTALDDRRARRGDRRPSRRRSPGGADPTSSRSRRCRATRSAPASSSRWPATCGSWPTTRSSRCASPRSGWCRTWAAPAAGRGRRLRPGAGDLRDRSLGRRRGGRASRAGPAEHLGRAAEGGGAGRPGRPGGGARSMAATETKALLQGAVTRGATTSSGPPSGPRRPGSCTRSARSCRSPDLAAVGPPGDAVPGTTDLGTRLIRRATDATAWAPTLPRRRSARVSMGTGPWTAMHSFRRDAASRRRSSSRARSGGSSGSRGRTAAPSRRSSCWSSSTRCSSSPRRCSSRVIIDDGVGQGRPRAGHPARAHRRAHRRSSTRSSAWSCAGSPRASARA